MIEFRAYGNPRGQPRPRAFAFHGKARVFDPGTAEGWKSDLAVAARPHLPAAPLEGALEVRLAFWFARPKSHSTKRGLRPDAPGWFTSKPDADNLAKAVLDAMTTLGFWRDDAQVSSLWIVKRYATEQDAPGVAVTVARIHGWMPR